MLSPPPFSAAAAVGGRRRDVPEAVAGREEEMIGEAGERGGGGEGEGRGGGEGEEIAVEEVEMIEEEEDGEEERVEAVAGGGGARGDRNEGSWDEKLEETFGRLRSCSSAAGKSEATPSSNRTSEDRNCDFGAAVISDGPVERFDSVGNDFTSRKLGKCRGPPEDVEDPESAVNGEMWSRCPRLTTSGARLRSLSPGTELTERNKRVAIICDFFARGWCIKGSSCKFLHIKDNVNSTPELVRRHGTTSSCIEEAAHDEGQKDDPEKSKSPGLPKQHASSVANYSALCSGSSLEQIQSQMVRENESMHQSHSIAVSKPLLVEDLLFSAPIDSYQLPPFKHHDGHVSADMDKGRDLQERSWSADDYRMHASKLSGGGSGSMRDYWLPPSSGSLRSFNLSQDKQLSSHAFITEDQVTNQGKFIGDSSPITSHPVSSGVKYLSTATILRSQHTSRLTSSSGNFDSFSEVSNPLSAQSILDVDYAGHQSSPLLGSSSKPACSDPGNLSRANISADLRLRFRNRRAFCSYDWEPSEPFRPSFFIPPTTISSPGNKSDPFRDSIEQHKTRDGESFTLSFSSRGASVLNTAEQWVHSDSKQNPVEERGNNSYSVSSHHGFNEHGLDKGSYSHGKDVNGSAVEKTENSVVDSQTENGLSKENDQKSDHANDSSHISGSSMDLGSALGSDGVGHEKDLLSDKVRQDIEMNVTQKKAADVSQESKALRHFRVALIDYVKELLKPTWQGGRLSKDAHNLIVKKAVDKVLSTLQPQQIPPNPESIKHFLSYSQLKLRKLVEAYVDKHGKD